MGTGIRRHHHHHSLIPQAGSLNTITPCAACKLLRRRCAEDCPFAPYFSPHEPLKFAAVHKVFGASNVSKMLMEVPEIQRADTANSLVYEANVRLRDPIYGCMGAISALQQRVQSLQSELNAVRAEILRYKYREMAAAAATDNNIVIAASTHVSSLVSPVTSSVAGATLPLVVLPLCTLPPPPSVLVSSSLSSSSSSSSAPLYTMPAASGAGYSSIPTSSGLSYFD